MSPMFNPNARPCEPFPLYPPNPLGLALATPGSTPPAVGSVIVVTVVFSPTGSISVVDSPWLFVYPGLAVRLGFEDSCGSWVYVGVGCEYEVWVYAGLDVSGPGPCVYLYVGPDFETSMLTVLILVLGSSVTGGNAVTGGTAESVVRVVLEVVGSEVGVGKRVGVVYGATSVDHE